MQPISEQLQIESPRIAPSRPAGKQQVIRGLLEGLLRGDWRGGDRLTEAEAVERYKVSRTPVREALLALQGLDLIELRPNCGAVFKHFGPEELKEVYEVRSMLEERATGLAAPRIGFEELDKLEASAEILTDPEAGLNRWAADRLFHNTIARNCGNRRLANEIVRYSDLVLVVCETVGKEDMNLQTTTRHEHLTILKAIRERDAKSAARAMRAHLNQAAASATISMRKLQGSS